MFSGFGVWIISGGNDLEENNMDPKESILNDSEHADIEELAPEEIEKVSGGGAGYGSSNAADYD